MCDFEGLAFVLLKMSLFSIRSERYCLASCPNMSEISGAFIPISRTFSPVSVSKVSPSIILVTLVVVPKQTKVVSNNMYVIVCLIVVVVVLPLPLTFWRLAQWRISEHKTVNTPQKLMRGRMFN